jgi:hypothetical protein
VKASNPIEEEITYVSLIRRTDQKRTPPSILRCRGKVLAEFLPNNKEMHKETNKISFQNTKAA